MKRRSKVGSKTGKARPRRARTLRRSFSAKKPRSTMARKEPEVARLTRELDEAHQQQLATSEVLSIIRQSEIPRSSFETEG